MKARLIFSTLLILGSTSALGSDWFISEQKIRDDDRCSTWVFKSNTINIGSIKAEFRENMDVCFRKDKRIYSFAIPRTLLSSEVNAHIQFIFAAASKAKRGSRKCLGKLDRDLYLSERYSFDGGDGYTATVRASLIPEKQPQETKHIDIDQVCIKMIDVTQQNQNSDTTTD